MNTIIEYRCVITGKLIDLVFDETEYYIQRTINDLKDQGDYDFVIVENPNNYTLFI
jgi:hypothetical protein